MSKRLLKKLVKASGHKISKIRYPIELPYIDVLDIIVRGRIKENSDFFFLQIGANDGCTDDPIVHLVKQNHLRGLLVEPQPATFKRLVENYRGEDQLMFENALITTCDQMVKFYSVPEDLQGLPYNFYLAGSLKREVLKSILVASQKKMKNIKLPNDIESLIKESFLPALKPETLLKKHNIDKIDLLVIDAMGYDYEIIKVFPFHSVKPSIIHFEHAILSPDEHEECLRYLSDMGYGFIDVSVDTIACLDVRTRRGFYSIN